MDKRRTTRGQTLVEVAVVLPLLVEEYVHGHGFPRGIHAYSAIARLHAGAPDADARACLRQIEPEQVPLSHAKAASSLSVSPPRRMVT